MAYKFERQNKFVVLTVKDLERYCTRQQLEHLNGILHRIGKGRKEDGKLSNSYVVVNQDEPYAEKVWQLIETGEIAKEIMRKLEDEPELALAFEREWQK